MDVEVGGLYHAEERSEMSTKFSSKNCKRKGLHGTYMHIEEDNIKTSLKKLGGKVWLDSPSFV